MGVASLLQHDMHVRSGFGHHTTSSANHDYVHDFIQSLEDKLLDTQGTVMTQCHRANNIDRFRDHLRKDISVSPIETKSKFVPT